MDYYSKPQAPLTRHSGVPLHLPGDEQFVSEYVADFAPAVTGYTYALFGSFGTEFLNQFFNSSTQIALATLSRGYTAPSVSINEVNYKGYEDYTIPGKLNVGKEVTIRFIDTQEGNLMDFFKSWFSIIKPMDRESYQIHQQMTKKINGAIYQLLYYGSVVVFTTDPTLGRVIDAVGFIDMWPTSYPMDIMNIEISNVDLLTFSVNFKFNRFMPRTKNLIDTCQNSYLPVYKSLEKLN